MRWLRGIGALAALMTALLGAPVALLAWGRLPTGWDILARPEDGSLLLAVLTVAGWVAWVAFAVSVTAEVAKLVGGGRWAVRIPLLGGLQSMCAGLLVAVLALAPSVSSSQDAPVAVAPPKPLRPAEPVRQDTPRVIEPEHYLVEPGDDLWSISAHLLGDGGRWPELVAANPEHLQDPTTRLAPGTRLALPASNQGSAKQVRVERGDTLSGLALEHLGSAGRWPRIAAANHELIEDPDHIEVGWRLAIPGAATARGKTAPINDRPTTGEAPEVEEAPRDSVGKPRSTPSAQRPASRSPTVAESSTPADEPGPAEQEAGEERPALPLLGTLGTLAAAAIIGVVEYRQFLRLRERPIGRRFVSAPDGALRMRTELGARQRPDPMVALDQAARAIGRYCYERGVPLPELGRVVVSESTIRFEWAQSTGLPPVGFTGTRERWSASVVTPPGAGEHPCPYPALVSLGNTDDGEVVLVDAERSRVLGVAAEDPGLRRSALASMGLELACAPWSAEVRLLAVGPDAELIVLAGGGRARTGSLDEALAEVRSLVAERRTALGDVELSTLRVDPNRSDAVAPLVVCVLDDAGAGIAEELDRLLTGPPAGVAVLVGSRPDAGAQWSLDGSGEVPRGRLAGLPGRMTAHAVPEPTREGVARLFRAAEDPETTKAPWWCGGQGRADNVLALPQRAYRGDDVDIVQLIPADEHPVVGLIGPAELRGAAGPKPARSRQQLVEVCAWLLEHPGSTATAMADGLAVAESTRRSNLSRLRAWLGNAPDGQPYLPDAYSGRVLLHEGVSSDWQRLQVLLAPGVDKVAETTLVAALELIRGAPLADASPAQWHWAEELRTDVSCALRDTGLVLVDRALASGEIDLARWAAARALVAAPDDEQLLCARIRTEHRAGNAAEVGRLVNQVTRQARLLEVDLLPETVQLCQRVIEGRVRARA